MNAPTILHCTKPLASASLKLATLTNGEVYLNFYADPPSTVPRVAVFTGKSAHDEAKEDASDSWESGIPCAGYLTTLVLMPSGLFEERYLFSL
jgi:hypothetical protein